MTEYRQIRVVVVLCALALGTASSVAYARPFGLVIRLDGNPGFSAGDSISGGRISSNNTGSGGAGSGTMQPTEPDKDQQGDSPCEKTDQPVDIAAGNKLKNETDFVTADFVPLQLVRTYSKGWAEQGIFGRNWASSFDLFR